MRFFWILFGTAAHLFFAATVCYLFPFLQGGEAATLAGASGSLDAIGARSASKGNTDLLLDSLLALQFGVLHSLLLWRRVRDRLEAFIPRPLYGCFFTLATCASLLLAILAWRPIPVVVWQLEGTAAIIVSVGYLLGWVALFYSLSLTGFGYQTGWTPYWAWLRRREPARRQFEPRGAYHLLRHPVYLSLLALIWLTPVLTLDRVLLGGCWTAYIFVGSYLKDRRLEFYLGDRYRQYQARVPGYPFFWFGPLGRVRASHETQLQKAACEMQAAR